jgi:hypothetical protein
MLKMPKIGNDQIGHIAIAEKLPFGINRVYWTYHTPADVPRGHHAHKTLQQLIFAVSGSIRIVLENAKGEQQTFELNNPSWGLYVPPMYWRTIYFSDSAVLLCLASAEFVETDYIRDYDQFRKSP